MNINESLADSLIRSTAFMGKQAGQILKDRPAATRGGSPKSKHRARLPVVPDAQPGGDRKSRHPRFKCEAACVDSGTFGAVSGNRLIGNLAYMLA